MEEEVVVYVGADGRPTGKTAPKLAAHNAQTGLHLAFSCYVFDRQGRLLVTRRAAHKKVWPGVWTNSVCGHPAPGENMLEAIRRRLAVELDMQASDFRIALPRYTYKTPPFNGVIEHEFCPVFVARSLNDPEPDGREVEAWRWVAWPEFVAAAEKDRTHTWSWWCKDQLKRLKHHPLIAEYTLRS
jgi:isopentenyl-diphosphate delta-isomerase